MNAEPLVITGVGRRLGLFLAASFMGRGMSVVGLYRTERPELERLREGGVTLLQCDFNDDVALGATTAFLQGRYPSIRALIHNASEWDAESDGKADGALFERMMKVHAWVPYSMNLALADNLAASREPYADIVHIGDYVSTRGSRKHIAYAASKAAQDNLTLSFAQRLAPRVKVNSIAPALVLFNDSDDPSYREKALTKSLMQREGGLDEFQRSVDYVLDSEFMTGRILPFDGGRHLR